MLTVQDFERYQDDGMKHELIQGEFEGAPELAIEVTSESNTAAELDRKMELYFCSRRRGSLGSSIRIFGASARILRMVTARRWPLNCAPRSSPVGPSQRRLMCGLSQLVQHLDH
jgi:Putative restriction endonuclease